MQDKKPKTTLDFLDEIAKSYPGSVKNDSQLAKLIGVSRATVSQKRHKEKSMSVFIAVRVAELLGVNPMITISAAMHEQATIPEEKDFWFEQYQRYCSLD